MLAGCRSATRWSGGTSCWGSRSASARRGLSRSIPKTGSTPSAAKLLHDPSYLTGVWSPDDAARPRRERWLSAVTNGLFDNMLLLTLLYVVFRRLLKSVLGWPRPSTTVVPGARDSGLRTGIGSGG